MNLDLIFTVLTMIGIYGILAMGLNLILDTGLSMLGFAAFFAIGAYVTGLSSVNLGLDPWIGLAISCILGAAGGIGIGIPVLRLKGDYFALGTMGFGIVMYSVLENWISLTRGPFGISGIPNFPFLEYKISTQPLELILVATILTIIYFVLNRIMRSPFGLSLIALRSDELLARTHGKNTSHLKLAVLGIGGCIGAIGGSLYSTYLSYIDPSSFSIDQSISVLLMAILGGIGTLAGPLVGAALLVGIPIILRFMGFSGSLGSSFNEMIFGVLLVLLLMKRPKGLLGKREVR